jgi:hypothetical protein
VRGGYWVCSLNGKKLKLHIYHSSAVLWESTKQKDSGSHWWKYSELQ